MRVVWGKGSKDSCRISEVRLFVLFLQISHASASTCYMYVFFFSEKPVVPFRFIVLISVHL